MGATAPRLLYMHAADGYGALAAAVALMTFRFYQRTKFHLRHFAPARAAAVGRGPRAATSHARADREAASLHMVLAS